MYGEYFIQEVNTTIDIHFSTIKNRVGKFIGGASAGDYTAWHNAFHHPNLFSKVSGHMPSLKSQLKEEDQPYFQNAENRNKYDPIYKAENFDLSSGLKVHLDAGIEDNGHF